MHIAELPAGTTCTFGERRGAPVLLAYVDRHLLRFDLDGRPIDDPIAIGLTGARVYAGADVAVLTRPMTAKVVDVVSGTVVETLEPVRDQVAVSRTGAWFAATRGEPFDDHRSLEVRRLVEPGPGVAPPLPFRASPLAVIDRGDDFDVLYTSGRRIARYDSVPDTSRDIVAIRHGEHEATASTDGTVVATPGSKDIAFIDGSTGTLLARTRRGAYALGPAGRIAVSPRKGVLETFGPGNAEPRALAKTYLGWLEYSLDGSLLAWGGAGAFGVLTT